MVDPDDDEDIEFATHPGVYRLALVEQGEPWDDDQELSDEIIVRLWIARLRALARAQTAHA
nr:hypothetical protein [Oxalobacteraceae bacterium]